MKYIAPPGGDPGAPYVDGNRSAGVRGSVVPAKAVEHPQRELHHLIDYAGLTPSDGDQEQVRKAIEALISAATGGGETSQFLLVSQARARLPIFPEVLSADGRINVSSPSAGTILVPPAVNFMHRGIFPVATSDYSEPNRTFATAASKTYHLRWDPTNGFRLRDLADAAYNPGVLPETSPVFDSVYDDMLIARVVTSAANVATISNLANKNTIKHNYARGTLVYPPGDLGNPAIVAMATETIALNFARTPLFFLGSVGNAYISGATPTDGSELDVVVRSLSRYEMSIFAFSVNHLQGRGGRPEYTATLMAVG
ncbi:MAG: hypothetical protein LCH86_07745 [Proteobacteria bacterium]|nr:hypothetical protein [Pseudomonadota bacterium]